MSQATMLSHLKVVEIADTLGAYTGRILTQLGAQVIKVEPPSGDPARARRFASEPTDLDAGVTWRTWNAGKHGARLDLQLGDDRDSLRDLLGQADILIQGDGDRLAQIGLDYHTLAAGNPGLISVIVQPFGEGGRLAGSPASDLTLIAMSGIMQIVGEPERPPLKLPGEQSFGLAGVQGAIASLLALNARNATGLGQRVVVSAYQSAVLAGYRDPLVWEWTGQIGRRTGNQLVRGKSGVRQIWPCQDGYVTWSLVDNPGMVKGLVGLMVKAGLAGSMAEVDWDNTLLADTPQPQIETWEGMIEPFFLSHTKADLSRLSAELGLGLSAIATPDDTLESPQWRSRGLWREIEDPARGITLNTPGPLYQTSAPQSERLRAAPRLADPSRLAFDEAHRG
jgi:crotonobetainyl-CoA:carnitine CoA-transferase CaiB-like acyl-CoA transferase